MGRTPAAPSRAAPPEQAAQQQPSAGVQPDGREVDAPEVRQTGLQPGDAGERAEAVQAEPRYGGYYDNGQYAQGYGAQYAGQYPGQYAGQYPGQYPGQYAGQYYPQPGMQWYQPFTPYGYMVPYPAPWWWQYPPYAPYFFPPPMPYPGMMQPYAAQQAGYYAQGAVPARRRTRPLVIALIIIGVLIVVGGAVTAALLMGGSTSASYRLGDAQVVGANIEFREMTIKQEGETVTLTGKYDNNTKYTGEVMVTVQAISEGQEQLLMFTVPVATGTNRTFSQQKSAGSLKLKGATLSSLVFQGDKTFDSDKQNRFPDEERQSKPDGQTSAPTWSQPKDPYYERQDPYDQYLDYSPDSTPKEDY